MIRFAIVMLALLFAVGCQVEKQETPAPAKKNVIQAPVAVPPADKKVPKAIKLDIPNAAAIRDRMKARNENAAKLLNGKAPSTVAAGTNSDPTPAKFEPEPPKFDAQCKADSDCTITKKGGSEFCCSGCSERAVSSKHLADINAYCGSIEQPIPCRPKKCAAPGHTTAKCLKGACTLVSVAAATASEEPNLMPE